MKTILIVDDDAGIRTALQRALSAMPCETRSAADGEQAREIINSEPIALVLLDLRMPRLDGMALLRELARDHPHVRVAILTGHGSVPDAVEAMKLGAVDYVEKPFSATEIRDLVEKVLARDTLDPDRVEGYELLVESAKKLINARAFPDAREKVRQAIAARSDAPEAYNLLGVLEEMRGKRLDAQSHYRVALDMQPNYRPAAENLRRSTSPPEERGGLTLE